MTLKTKSDQNTHQNAANVQFKKKSKPPLPNSGYALEHCQYIHYIYLYKR